MKLILGTVQLGLSYGINNSNGKPKPEDAYNILHQGYESGIRILDTAEAYGSAHEIIGNFHKLNPELKFKVITKISPSETISDIGKKVIFFINTLHVNSLEAIMFHSFESYLNNKEVLPCLVELKKSGLIKQIGVSAYKNEEIELLINDCLIDLIQIPFNILDNFSIRGKLMEEAKIKGKTIHTRSAFLQGLFFMNPNDNHPVINSLKIPLMKIQNISDESGYSIPSIALNYCIQQKYIDKVLVGVDSADQLKINIQAIKTPLPDDIIKSINKIVVEDINLLNPSLWKFLKH